MHPAWESAIVIPVMEKKLRRSSTEKVIAGVCGGIGAYLGIDPVVVRIALVLFTLCGGAGVLVYLVCWLCMPTDFGPYGGAM